MKLNDYNKEDLIEIILAYNEYQNKCPKDEQISLASFMISNGIARLKYDKGIYSEEEYEENKYPKIKTVSDKLQSIEKVEELRKLFIKPIIKPRFKLGQAVINTIINDYFTIREIAITEEGIIYLIDNGSVIVDIEEKYLESYKEKVLYNKDKK